VTRVGIGGALSAPCPCGTGRTYDQCCGALHRGERLATTAVELMRSRYAAYVHGVLDHLFRTWHPRTRPTELSPDPATTWTGLEVLGATGGGPDDDEGTVEFRASFRSRGGAGSLHELSRFARRAGRWVYVDGDVR
jgi:SEC-C motif-containing protein